MLNQKPELSLFLLGLTPVFTCEGVFCECCFYVVAFVLLKILFRLQGHDLGKGTAPCFRKTRLIQLHYWIFILFCVDIGHCCKETG